MDDARHASRERTGRTERPFVLVLDDLHAVARPSCRDVLAALIPYVPAGSQIAIATREEPALPLARWRAQGSVEEFGVADLRLDEQEAESLLEAAGVELDVGELSELTARTEGWPAGLYLAALSIQAGAAGSASATGFDGDDRFVSDYLHSELLSRLPLAEAQFLKYTSLLDRMSGDLCDAVLETTGSARILEKLERTNRFVVPLDRHGEWYRYHHLFGQLLRNELERSEPDVGAGAQPSCDGLVHRRRLARGRRRLRARRVRQTRSRGWSTLWRCRSTTTAGWRRWRSGSGGSATTSWRDTRRSPSMEPGSVR